MLKNKHDDKTDEEEFQITIEIKKHKNVTY